MPTDADNWKQKLLAYRKKNFAVEVTPARASEFEGEIRLSVTINGNQWQSIGLLPDEVQQVIKALSDYEH